MIEFEDLMKLKVGDTVVCCDKASHIMSYEPGEIYGIVKVNGDDMELRPLYDDKNFSFEQVSYDDLYKHFMLPDEDDFYQGDLAVLQHQNELHYVYIKYNKWVELFNPDSIKRKYKTGDEVYCEMCPNMHDISEIKNFGWVDKTKLVKIHHHIVNLNGTEILPGMNLEVEINGHRTPEKLLQIEIFNGAKKFYMMKDSLGYVHPCDIVELTIPMPKYRIGTKIICQNYTQFIVTKVSDFIGQADVGCQYMYDVAGLNFNGDNKIEIFEYIPENQMCDIYGYLKELSKCSGE